MFKIYYFAKYVNKNYLAWKLLAIYFHNPQIDIQNE